MTITIPTGQACNPSDFFATLSMRFEKGLSLERLVPEICQDGVQKDIMNSVRRTDHVGKLSRCFCVCQCHPDKRLLSTRSCNFQK